MGRLRFLVEWILSDSFDFSDNMVIYNIFLTTFVLLNT
jgi:hypothetical protein